MPTRRARSGRAEPTGRRHVGLTLPAAVKHAVRESAGVLGWSVGDWVLAAAAAQGERLASALGDAATVPRRPAVAEPRFCALYLTPDEREELDEQARAVGLNRSAFVTAVARLDLGATPEAVRADLLGQAPAGR